MNDKEIMLNESGIDKKHGMYGVLKLCMKKARQDERANDIAIIKGFRCEDYPKCQDTLGSGSPCSNCARLDDIKTCIEMRGRT
jgi:hypothetical protein